MTSYDLHKSLSKYKRNIKKYASLFSFLLEANHNNVNLLYVTLLVYKLTTYIKKFLSFLCVSSDENFPYIYIKALC